MDIDIEKKFARLGLNSNLWRVYQAAIELGDDVLVSKLIARTELPRTTVYDAISRLEEEGLVEVLDIARKKHVRAHDPAVLLEQVEARRQMLDDMMPQLRAMYNQIKSKPNIRFYEGSEGIRTALIDSLKGEFGEVRAIFAMSELEATPGLAFIDNEYCIQRLERNISMRVVRSRKHDTVDTWPSSHAHQREVRFSPPRIDLAMTTLIHAKRVTFISSRQENYALVIESVEYAALMSALFETLWSVSEAAPFID